VFTSSRSENGLLCRSQEVVDVYKENVKTLEEDIMDMIKTELKKERITSMTELTQGITKTILKKIKLSKFYEHTLLL